MTPPLLAATSLEKAFRRDQALRGASLAVAPGEIVAVRGRSGSGKSTLLHCLGGILRPDAGAVWLDGTRIDGLSDARRAHLRRTRLGFVFQAGELVPDLALVDNVALPLLLGGMPARAARAEAAAWLERLGLRELGSARPDEASGGERQRAAIARALVHGPAVVLADEPTGALDSVAAEDVMRLLAAQRRERDVAIVLVTHDARVAAYADREETIVDGRLGAPLGAVQAVGA